MSTILWTPSEEYKIDSNIWRFKSFVENELNLKFDGYSDLHNWSIDKIDQIWEFILKYFKIQYEGHYNEVLDWNDQEIDFINARWFEGISLSYAEHIFTNSTTQYPALKLGSENDSYTEISWAELADKVSILQQYLLNKNIKQGDRVVGILNNTIDTIAIFLATNSLGAIWSCCSPDFGDKAILDRFAQVEPKILFIEGEYQYNDKLFSKRETVDFLAKNISSLQDIIEIDSEAWDAIFNSFQVKELIFKRVPFSHPIWILYSSGTTGIPKAIVHSTGGNLLEHYKALALHQNVKKGDNFLWYTTTGWMMWNYALSSLLCGATLCLFDGSITHHNNLTFWNFLKRAKVDHLGAGAVYFSTLTSKIVEDYKPKTIASTGSTLSPQAFETINSIFPGIPIISLSGGTDVCSAFLSGCALLPVFAGQIQCKTLGSAIESFDDSGKSVLDEVGELVITKPLPSMPLYFWNDSNNVKYKESYFEKFKGKWAHGDWIKINENEGIIIFGRSDSTLNRDGIRIGTAEIYNTVNSIPIIKDSLVITIDKENEQSKMILFVQTFDQKEIKEEDIKRIKYALRTENSPRHVPDQIYQVKDIPYTLSGKKLEIAVKKLCSGIKKEKAFSMDVIRNPECIEEYINYAKSHIS